MKDIAITENHLYQKVFRRGQRWSGRLVTVSVLKDLHAKRLRKEHPQKVYVNRIGLSVPKREGGAVERNRVKRILRAGLAEVRKKRSLKTGYLIVISTRPGIEKEKSTAVASELYYVFKKLDMFESPANTSGCQEGKNPSATS